MPKAWPQAQHPCCPAATGSSFLGASWARVGWGPWAPRDSSGRTAGGAGAEAWGAPGDGSPECTWLTADSTYPPPRDPRTTPHAPSLDTLPSGPLCLPRRGLAANATMSSQRSSQGSARQDFKWSLSPEAAEAKEVAGRGCAGPGGKALFSWLAPAGGGGWDTPLTKKGKGLSPFPSLHSLRLGAICIGGGAFLPPPVACLGQRALRREGQAAAPGPCAGHGLPVRLGSWAPHTRGIPAERGWSPRSRSNLPQMHGAFGAEPAQGSCSVRDPAPDCLRPAGSRRCSGERARPPSGPNGRVAGTCEPNLPDTPTHLPLSTSGPPGQVPGLSPSPSASPPPTAARPIPTKEGAHQCPLPSH